MLFKKFKVNKKKIALLSSSSVSLSYGDLENQYRVIKKIIPSSSLILMITENSIGSIASYTSFIKNDCVVQLVDSKTNIFEIQNLINLYKPNYISCSKTWYEKHRFNKFNLKSIYTYFENNIFKTQFTKLKKLKGNLSILMPTSGSMGSKKYVKISKENIFNNTISIISYLKLNKQNRSITSMPFCYSYMLSVINSHLEVGGSIFVTEETIIQSNFWKYFKEKKVNNFNGVPYHYEILIKLGLKKNIFSKLKFFTQAGGKLDNLKTQGILNFCLKEKKIFYVMYGQTEASPRMSYVNLTASPSKIGSIGKPIPGGNFFIIDNDGKKITKENVTGELVYKGKNVSTGYANNYKDLLKKNTNKKLLKTGDLAFYDRDKFYFITGRKSRIIKLYGNRFNLDDIEERFFRNKISLACINVNDNLILFLEKSYSRNTLIKKIYEITSTNKIDIKIKVLKKIPRLNNGKINYKKLSYQSD